MKFRTANYRWYVVSADGLDSIPLGILTKRGADELASHMQDAKVVRAVDVAYPPRRRQR
jgi:hypothetical protein